MTRAQQLETSGRRLIEAASALIAEKGWEATSAAEIGRRAGYSRAMVAQRFGSKDALLDALLDSNYEQRLMPQPAEGITGLQRILGMIHRLGEVYEKDPTFLEALFMLGFEAVKRSSAVKARMTSFMDNTADLIEDALEAGIKDGSVGRHVDASHAATDIAGAIVGIAYGWLVLPSRFDLPAQLDQLARRIVSDFGRSPRRRQP